MIDSKKKSFAIAALRRSSMKWGPRNAAKIKGRKKLSVQVQSKRGISVRDIWHYQCAKCSPDYWYRDKDIELDHINPVVDVTVGWVGFDVFIDRLYCDENGFQRLCSKHHEEKSLAEGIVRRKSKKAKNKV